MALDSVLPGGVASRIAITLDAQKPAIQRWDEQPSSPGESRSLVRMPADRSSV